MLTDKDALKEVTELITKILFLCKEYADRDGIDFQFVVKTTAEAMLKIAMNG